MESPLFFCLLCAGTQESAERPAAPATAARCPLDGGSDRATRSANANFQPHGSPAIDPLRTVHHMSAEESTASEETQKRKGVRNTR